VSTGYLSGKVALISGSYKNLGSVIATALAEQGADIVFNDLPGVLSQQEKEQLVDSVRRLGRKATAIDADISSFASVQALQEKIRQELGEVSIVVNCAGPFNMEPFSRLKERDWDIVMNVNVKSVYITTSVFAVAMKALGWGRIVNLSAGSSSVRNHGVYGLAKSAIRVLTEELALELGPEITVNAVAPGQIEESLPLIHAIDPTFGERYTARSALKKLVTRKDVAQLIAMLCSPVADMITGETIRIDGGAELPRF